MNRSQNLIQNLSQERQNYMGRKSHVTGPIKTVEGEDVLNETIDKLDYLERKISSIMHKNDQLRSLLKRKEDPPPTEEPKRLSQHGSMVHLQSFNQYLHSKASREEISTITFIQTLRCESVPHNTRRSLTVDLLEPTTSKKVLLQIAQQG